MKIARKIASAWNISRAARMCTVSLIFSMSRFLYFREVPNNLLLAWLDLFIIPIMCAFLAAGWILLCRQIAKGHAINKQPEPTSEILDHWDNEISALSWELWEAGQHQCPPEEIEAIQQRLDEAHQRRAREAAILRKQS